MSDIKNVGFTVGDIYSEKAAQQTPRPVLELTPDQVQLRNRIHGALECLPPARKSVETLEKAINQMRKECTHPVFVDREGYPMDSRICVICDMEIDRI